MAEVLLIDRDTPLCEALVRDIAGPGLAAHHCQSLARGMAMLHTGDYKAVILGDNLVDGDSLSFIEQIRDIHSQPEVIFLSSRQDPDVAEQAIQSGSWNILFKPPNRQRLMVFLGRVMEYHMQRQARPKPRPVRRKGIIGQSRPLLACLEEVAHAASTEANVLVVGETGTGKELFARAIHENSRRAKKPFVVVDCAAMPDTLVESLLFGHEKGAFTSADNRSIGLIKQADGGTLFLDEIGELPLSIQKVFLRVLEGRSFRLVGGTQEVRSDFRLVAATNRDLESMVKGGTFRQDLFYRIRGIRIVLPPLRVIVDDVSDLACHFLTQLCTSQGKPLVTFSQDFLDVIMNYHWPGNIRELMHTMERSLSMAEGEATLYPRHLPRGIRAFVARQSLRPSASGCTASVKPDMLAGDTFPTLREYREKTQAEAERRYLEALLSATGGEVAASCQRSGLSRARLYALLKKYRLRRSPV